MSDNGGGGGIVIDDGKATRPGRQCGNKRMYPDQAIAVDATKVMKRKTQVKFDAYACPWCKAWHIGRHKTPEQIRRKQERVTTKTEN